MRSEIQTERPSFEANEGWLRRVLLRRFGREKIEDLIQETFARYSARHDAKAVRNPRALLLTIAVGLGKDMWRREAVRERAKDAIAAAAATAEQADQEQLVLIKQIILGLPDDCREIFILHRLHGLTYDQVARETGLTLKAVEGRMSKALAICMRQLAE